MSPSWRHLPWPRTSWPSHALSGSTPAMWRRRNLGRQGITACQDRARLTTSGVELGRRHDHHCCPTVVASPTSRASLGTLFRFGGRGAALSPQAVAAPAPTNAKSTHCSRTLPHTVRSIQSTSSGTPERQHPRCVTMQAGVTGGQPVTPASKLHHMYHTRVHTF